MSKATEEGPNIVALLEASVTPRPTQVCWGAGLEGEAAEYVRGLCRLYDEGRRIVWARAEEVLRVHFGIDKSPTSISTHVRGACRCPR